VIRLAFKEFRGSINLFMEIIVTICLEFYQNQFIFTGNVKKFMLSKGI
jgi:hypothetical protein